MTHARMDTQSVLFACTMNTIRSPMAEAIARHYFPRRIYAQSCGTRHGSANAFIVEILGESGFAIGTHHSRVFDELGDSNFDIIIAMTQEAHHHARDWARHCAGIIEYWEIEDPSLAKGSRSSILDSYRKVRDELSERILRRFSRQE